MRSLIFAALALTCVRAAEPGDPRPKKDAKAETIAKELKRMEGTWECAAHDFTGTGFKPPAVAGSRFVFRADGSYEIHHPMNNPITGKLSLDPAARPKTLDVTYTNASIKGKGQLGIYEWEGDTLLWAVGRIDGPRPTEFTGGPNGERTVSIFRRVKDKK